MSHTVENLKLDVYKPTDNIGAKYKTKMVDIKEFQTKIKLKKSTSERILCQEFEHKILIVDDQSFNIDALRIILKYNIGLNSDIFCDSALSGEKAMEMIK